MSWTRVKRVRKKVSLSGKDIEDICRKYLSGNYTQRALATEYEVGTATIHNILTKKGLTRERMKLRKTLKSNSIQTDDGCRLWTGKRDRYGFGLIKTKNTTEHVHRVAFEVYTGTNPAGYYVCRSCERKLCFSVEHMYLVKKD